MKQADGGFAPSYNAQISTDAQETLIHRGGGSHPSRQRLSAVAAGGGAGSSSVGNGNRNGWWSMPGTRVEKTFRAWPEKGIDFVGSLADDAALKRKPIRSEFDADAIHFRSGRRSLCLSGGPDVELRRPLGARRCAIIINIKRPARNATSVRCERLVAARIENRGDPSFGNRRARRSVRFGGRWPARKHKRFTGGVGRWPSLCMPGSKVSWGCGNFMCAGCAKYEPKCSGPASPTTCSNGSGSDAHLTRLLRANRARKATTRIRAIHSRNANKWASRWPHCSRKDVFSQLLRLCVIFSPSFASTLSTITVIAYPQLPSPKFFSPAVHQIHKRTLPATGLTPISHSPQKSPATLPSKPP